MKILSTIFISFCVISHALAGQQLQLKDAISAAMEKNSRIKHATFSAAAAHEEVAIARSHYYPAVFFEETFNASNAPPQAFMMKLDQGRFSQNDFQIGNLNHPSLWHDFKTTLSIQQSLYNPSLSPLRDMAAADAQGFDLVLEATRQDIAFQTFRSYLEVQKAAARIKVAAQSAAEANENLRLAAVRTAAGSGLRSDELRARTHQSLVEQRLITLRNDLTLARLRLALLTGHPEHQDAEITDSIIRCASPPSVEDLLQTALQHRIDARQFQAGLKKTAAALQLAQSSYFPTVNAIATYQLNGKDTPVSSDNDSWSAGVSLKWQLFDGFRRTHERDRALAGRSSAIETIEQNSREIRFQVQESYLRYEESGKRLQAARHALQDAEETVRLLSRRFENSLATMLDLLDAQTALAQTRANLVDTEADCALASGQIYYSAGIFLKETLK